MPRFFVDSTVSYTERGSFAFTLPEMGVPDPAKNFFAWISQSYFHTFVFESTSMLGLGG